MSTFDELIKMGPALLWFCLAMVVIYALIEMVRNSKKEREQRKALRFQRGYNYAAGLILMSKGHATPSDMIWQDDHDGFDDGILKAESDFEQLIANFKRPDHEQL